MTIARQRLGRRGEDLAAADLERRGWVIVARNARIQGIRGELDIVARDGATLVFVEVKTVSAANAIGPVSPLEMVDSRKRGQLRRLAGAWAARHGSELRGTRAVRIDVIGIVLEDGAPVAWDHVEGAC